MAPSPPLHVGALAPDFRLPATAGPGSPRREVSLGDYRGRCWLILLFYPRDFSLVCPTELTGMSSRIDEFRKMGAEILGISTDDVATHEQWISAPRAQGGLGGLNFPLASDTDGAVAKAYGVYLEFQKVCLRGLFILDPNTVLQYQVVHNLSIGRRSDEVLRVLAGLQTGGMCPESWTPGQEIIDPTRSFAPGSAIGQYRIEAVLGSGSFATVFRARDLTLERPVALKVLKQQKVSSPAAILNEARAAARLNHPNACTIFSVDSSEGVPFIAMEYVPGQPLAAILEAGPLPGDRVKSLARQIAEGMAAAHASGIVHGDLKPANIMVTTDGMAKIMDFGLAQPERQSQAGLETTLDAGELNRGISGTPSYMSPEQAWGQPLTAASDVFSLGAILYEMITHHRAFSGDNVLEVLHRIDQVSPQDLAGRAPSPFDRILVQALERDVHKRTITMAKIAELLA